MRRPTASRLPTLPLLAPGMTSANSAVCAAAHADATAIGNADLTDRRVVGPDRRPLPPSGALHTISLPLRHPMPPPGRTVRLLTDFTRTKGRYTDADSGGRQAG